MVDLKTIQKAIQEEKDRIRKLGIDRVGIFGSYIRGEANEESDVDILIELNENSKLTLFSLIELEQDLSQKINKNIDVVIRSNLKKNMARNILAEVQYV